MGHLLISKNYPAKSSAYKTDVQLIRQTSGPAICEDIALCYFAQKPFIFDPFTTSQMAKGGLLSETDTVKKVGSGYFSLIQLYDSAQQDDIWFHDPCQCHLDRFTVSFMDEMVKHYHLIHHSVNGYFYAPN